MRRIAAAIPVLICCASVQAQTTQSIVSNLRGVRVSIASITSKFSRSYLDGDAVPAQHVRRFPDSGRLDLGSRHAGKFVGNIEHQFVKEGRENTYRYESDKLAYAAINFAKRGVSSGAGCLCPSYYLGDTPIDVLLEKSVEVGKSEDGLAIRFKSANGQNEFEIVEGPNPVCRKIISHTGEGDLTILGESPETKNGVTVFRTVRTIAPDKLDCFTDTLASWDVNGNVDSLLKEPQLTKGLQVYDASEHSYYRYGYPESKSYTRGHEQKVKPAPNGSALMFSAGVFVLCSSILLVRVTQGKK